MNKTSISLAALAVSAGLLCVSGAEAGSSVTVVGRTVDEQGRPLAGVPVCLRFQGDPSRCVGVAVSDDEGHYAFAPLRARGRYSVAVSLPSAAMLREAGAYRAYVWSPASADVRFVRTAEGLQRVDFVGTFSFGNFQRSLRLTADDLPELGQFDLPGDYVFAKVYFSDTDAQQHLIFLGRVTRAEALAIEASVPFAVDRLQYEIFSPTRAVAGAILLTDAS